jgi:hypothetical protein
MEAMRGKLSATGRHVNAGVGFDALPEVDSGFPQAGFKTRHISESDQ